MTHTTCFPFPSLTTQTLRKRWPQPYMPTTTSPKKTPIHADLNITDDNLPLRRQHTMPSKSNRRKGKKPTRNWLELPSDLMLNILQRLGAFYILQNAQKVCTAWREICMDPAMWTVIYINKFPCPSGWFVRQQIYKIAVDRSHGQLVDLTIIGFCTPELVHYVADRSSQLRRLEIAYYSVEMHGTCSEAFKKLLLLEELILESANISPEDIESPGRYCPLLKTLKLSRTAIRFSDLIKDNELASAIGKNLHQLTRLQLIGYCIKNSGLQAIMDGCCHLESLDLHLCFCTDLTEDIRKRCSRQIKYLKLPDYSPEEHLRIL